MPQMHALRRDRAAAVAAGLGADAVLITSGVNVRYLTGLASSNAAVLIRPGRRAERMLAHRFEVRGHGRAGRARTSS